MTRRHIALLLGLAALFMGSPRVQAAEITWGDSLEKAIQLAKKTKKPILIDLYADWCGWCKRLDADVYTDPQVIKTSSQFITVKLDTERNGRMAARQYRVSNLPTILVINATGEVETRINGYHPAPEFNIYLTQAAEAHRELPRLLARYRSNVNDLDAAVRLTQVYARRGDESQAQRSLARVAKLDPADEKGKYAKSLTAVADLYAGRGNYDEAIPLFRRALKTAHSTDEIGYSQLSLAVCQFYRRDVDSAQNELKAAIANPKITGKFRADAQKMLSKIQEIANKRG